MHRPLQRVNTGVGNGGVGHLAVDSNFHLQAAVVRGDDLVAEACGDHQIGLGEALGQQPAWAFFATKLFVISEMQFHTTFERCV